METDKILNRIGYIATAIFLMSSLLICSGCMTYIGKDCPYYGKIVDKETRQPLEGVVVIGDWGIGSWGGGTAYYDTYETVTDLAGNFTIPGQGFKFFSDLTEVQLFALKAGYEDVPGYIWNTVVRLSIGKEGERIIIGLKKLTTEERKRRSIGMPVHAPKYKLKLLIKEYNREMTEIGWPKNYLYPEE